MIIVVFIFYYLVTIFETVIMWFSLFTAVHIKETHFFVTEFIQKIYNQKHDKRRVRAVGLIPAETEFQKSVSSLVIDPGTSLRLYYSQPVIKIR